MEIPALLPAHRAANRLRYRFELTRAERDKLAGVVRAVTGELQKGWGAFVDSFAKGLGSGLA